MRRSIALGTAAGAALVIGLAAPALAVYPPDPSINGGSSTNVTPPGGGTVDFTFGNVVPFTPGSTVQITSTCTNNGATFAGPSATATAGANGVVKVSLTFT